MLTAPVLRAIPSRDLNVRIELGRAEIPFRDLHKLRESIVLLDRKANDPVDIVVGEKVVARGELMLMNDELAVRVTELVQEQVA